MSRWRFRKALRILNIVVIATLLAPWNLAPTPAGSALAGEPAVQEAEMPRASSVATIIVPSASPTERATSTAQSWTPATARATLSTAAPSSPSIAERSPDPSGASLSAPSSPSVTVPPLPVPADRAQSSPATTTAVAEVPEKIDRAEIDPVRGGTLRSSDGKVEVSFQPGAAAEPLQITHQPTKMEGLPDRRRVRSFQLNAYATARQNAPVHRFAGPVEITVHYSAADVAGINVASLKLSYHDEVARRWVDLPTLVDAKTRTVRASMDHFTDVFVGGDPNISGPGLMKNFQTDLHSGAATAEYPIELPPGPSGFQPQLNLTYNSGRMDEMKSGVATCSWVGCGWSLDLGRVSYDDYYKRYTLELNGAAFELAQDSAQGWHTKSEQYFYIRFDQSAHSWTVWDRSGVRYEFGGTDDSTHYYWSSEDGWHKLYYRYDLSRMVDTHGNVVNVSHNIVTGWQYFDDENHEYHRSAYPARISFGASQQIWVDFSAASNDTDPVQGAIRSDNPIGSEAPLVLETRFLEHLTVSVDGTRVRRYRFQYDFDARDWGGGSWKSGNMRLRYITELGLDDSAALPAMTLVYTNEGITFFDYGTGEHNGPPFRPRLRTVSNGYGGLVTYDYDEFNREWPNTWTRQIVMTRTVSSGYEVTRTTAISYGAISYLLPVPPPGHDATWSGDSQFRGFSYVAVTDPDANPSTHNYYTTWADAGEQAVNPFGGSDAEIFSGREITATYYYRDAQNGQHSRTVSRVYAKRPVYGKINFVMLERQDVWLDGRRTRSNYVYDGYGNVSWITDYHESDSSYRIRELVYYPNASPGQTITTTKWIVDRKARETLHDTSRAAETWYLYDNQSLTTPPTVGDLTLVRRFIDLSLDAGSYGGSTADTSYTYDSYGNRTSETVYDRAGYARRPLSGQGETATAAGSGGTAYTASTTWDTSHTFPSLITYPETTHGSETLQYDRGLGQLKRQTDPNSAATVYGYDKLGRLEKIWLPGESQSGETQSYGPTIQYTYDDSAQPAKLTIDRRTDLGGPGTPQYHRTLRFYDGLGRLIQEKVQAEGGSYVVTSTSYDALGRQFQVSVPITTTDAEYNAPSWASLKKTAYTYDALGRVLSVAGPDGTVTATSYSGWTTRVKDARNNCRESTVDAFGRLVQVREYTDSCNSQYTTTTYAYDAGDRLTGVTDASGSALQTSISYDALGRKTAMSDPDMGVWQYAYDVRGNLRGQRDARNVALLFGYDGESRLTSKGLAPSEPISVSGITALRAAINAMRVAMGLSAATWTQTIGTSVAVKPAVFLELRDRLRDIPGLGNIEFTGGAPAVGAVIRASVIADLRRWVYGDETFGRTMVATANFGYDIGGNKGKGRRTSSDAAGYSASWSYDLRGRITQDTQNIDSVAYTTSYTYDALDRPRSMTYPGSGSENVSFGYNDRTLLSSVGSYVTSISYNALGKPLSLVNGQSVSTNYTYDPNHFRLSSIGFFGTGAPNLSFGYTYDAVGNIYQLTENSATTTFSYDWADRLVSTSGGYSASYVYDLIGDLTSKHEAGATRNLVYNLSTLPKHAPKTVDGVTQTYDANGNLVGDGTRTLSYDAENRLISVTSGGNTVQFVYDSDGKRIKKIENGQTTVYVGKHYEKNLGTGVETKYYQALDQPVAMWQTDTGTTYLYRDHLGSTSAASNGSTRSYWPFGSERSSSGATPTDRRYTGQQWNSSIGLYYYGARFYDPAIGRFISADTIVPDFTNPQSLNRYSLALNNPLRYRDRNGHLPDDAVESQLGFLRGIGRGLWNAATGVVGLVKGAAGLIVSEQDRKAFGDTIAFIAQHPKEAGESAVSSAVEPYQNLSFDEPGEIAEVIGMAGTDIALTVIGTKGIGNLNKVEKVTKPIQRHHFIPYANSKWTPEFRRITDKYGLDIKNSTWNQGLLPQSGRHPTQYHKWVLQQLQDADSFAQGDSKMFNKYLDKNLKDVVIKNPAMLDAEWWIAR